MFFVGVQATWALLIYLNIVAVNSIARSVGVFYISDRWFDSVVSAPTTTAAVVFSLLAHVEGGEAATADSIII
jgi:hypothetical protein